MYFAFGNLMPPELLLLDQLCAAILILNPFVNLNTAVYIDGSLVCERKFIVQNYIISNLSAFLIELISISAIFIGWDVGYLVCALRIKEITRMY